MFLEAVHFLVKNLYSGHRPAPGRLVIVGLLLLIFVAILAACGNGVGDVTRTPPGEVTPPVEVTRIIVITPRGQPPPGQPIGRPLDVQERLALGDFIDNSGLTITATRVALTSSHGILLTNIQSAQEESFLIPDNNNGRTILGRLSQLDLEEFGLIGTVNKNPIVDEGTGGNNIGLLYVDQFVLDNPTETEEESVIEEGFEAGFHEIILFNETNEPENADIQLRAPSGNIFEPLGRELVERGVLGLEGTGPSAFLFTVGSHRCYICPWFLSHCICFNCPHW